MSPLVRAARSADIPRIAEIKVRSWADTYSAILEPAVLAPFLNLNEQRDKLTEVLSRPGTLLLVAEVPQEGVIGFGLTFTDDLPDPWLESLHVMPERRAAGGGTALMRATAKELMQRGLRTLRLGVVSGNTAAERFYERLGAVHTGREPTDWARGVWHEIYRWPDVSILANPA